jgi:ABC-type lipoprotein release transport system permease subunit
MAIPLAYNLRNLFVRRLSTAITITGIALVVAVFVAMLALARGFQAALAENGLPNNAIILRVPGNDELSSEITREQAAIIMTQPEFALAPEGDPIAVTEQVVVINLKRKSTGGISNILTRGTRPRAPTLRPAVRIIEGRMWREGTEEVIVGKILSERFQGCAMGDRINFGGRDWLVVGIFEAGGTSFESEIWGDVEVMAPAFDRSEYQSITFRLSDPAYFDAVRKRLEEDRRLKVIVKREKDYYSDQSVAVTGTIRFLGTFVTIIMAFGAVFGALNTMYAAISARRTEIGTLLALGFSRGSVLISFLVESLILAAIGGALGCLLALPVNGVSAGTTNWTSFSEVAFRIRIEPGMMAAGMMFALAMGSIGGLFPAMNAAKSRIAESIRRA